MHSLIVGLDEVGRGALAGPVAVGAFAFLGDGPTLCASLLEELALPRLTDSKKHTKRQREAICAYLEATGEAAWAVGSAEAAEIDAFGLTAAISLAAERALANLAKQGIRPAAITADAGLRHPFEKSVPTTWTVKGDESIPVISLASIMAKVWRDRLMAGLEERYPGYRFAAHVGYCTAAHREAILRLGITSEHRLSFLKASVPSFAERI